MKKKKLPRALKPFMGLSNMDKATKSYNLRKVHYNIFIDKKIKEFEEKFVELRGYKFDKETRLHLLDKKIGVSIKSFLRQALKEQIAKSKEEFLQKIFELNNEEDSKLFYKLLDYFNISVMAHEKR